MLRIPKSMMTPALVLSLSALGCADNESSLYVEGVLAIENSDCIARPDAQATFRSMGVLDLAFGNGYQAAVQVGNQLTQRGDREKLRTETSRMHLEGAEVTVFGTQGSESSFTSAATGFVHPANGTDPGLAGVFVELVQPNQIEALRSEMLGQIIVRMRIFGTTIGGQEVESGDYDFPILLCEGCLVTYPPSARDTSQPAGSPYICGPAQDTSGSNDAQICSLGQDQVAPCSLCLQYPICVDPALNSRN